MSRSTPVVPLLAVVCTLQSTKAAPTLPYFRSFPALLHVRDFAEMCHSLPHSGLLESVTEMCKHASQLALRLHGIRHCQHL